MQLNKEEGWKAELVKRVLHRLTTKILIMINIDAFHGYCSTLNNLLAPMNGFIKHHWSAQVFSYSQERARAINTEDEGLTYLTPHVPRHPIKLQRYREKACVAHEILDHVKHFIHLLVHRMVYRLPSEINGQDEAGHTRLLKYWLKWGALRIISSHLIYGNVYKNTHCVYFTWMRTHQQHRG